MNVGALYVVRVEHSNWVGVDGHTDTLRRTLGACVGEHFVLLWVNRADYRPFSRNQLCVSLLCLETGEFESNVFYGVDQFIHFYEEL